MYQYCFFSYFCSLLLSNYSSPFLANKNIMTDEELKTKIDNLKKYEEEYDRESIRSEYSDAAKFAFDCWMKAIIDLFNYYYTDDDELFHNILSKKCSDAVTRFDFFHEIKNQCNYRVSVIESGREKLLPIKQSLQKQVTEKNKPPKVFISHKREDKAFADALITLINFVIGADGEKIFCSSIFGYGIKHSRVIREELKKQFDENEIFMVIIHSPRYYQSAICLNEMGASWVLGTKFASFMTKDCKYSDLKGVIDNSQICININEDDFKAHLNDFKEELLSFFYSNTPPKIDTNKWEHARDEFVKTVSQLSYAQEGEKANDYFISHYIPYFDHIFELLDIDDFKNWAYECAIDGNTILKRSIYDNLDSAIGYIKSRPQNKDYSSWDSLLQNLGQLISDFNKVFSQHAIEIGDGSHYSVRRFYKISPYNPNYDEDLEAYNQHVRLISDLIFEMARLFNLILSKIRLFDPEYKMELGVLILENSMDAPSLVYRESEISDAPYPGLIDFIRVRLTRELHFGDNPRIGPDGYERFSSSH